MMLLETQELRSSNGSKMFLARLAILTILLASIANAQENRSSPSWDVYPVHRALPFGGFSLPAEVPTLLVWTRVGPHGGATFAIRKALDNAKSSVLVQAYSFTSAPIAEALVKAHRRGVDKSTSSRSQSSDTS